eukprot:6186540-Pleurochrysis_carterae.AAC.2
MGGQGRRGGKERKGANILDFSPYDKLVAGQPMATGDRKLRATATPWAIPYPMVGSYKVQSPK